MANFDHMGRQFNDNPHRTENKALDRNSKTLYTGGMTRKAVTYERVTYRPEGAKRSRTVLLQNTQEVSFMGEKHLMGIEVDVHGDEAAPTGVDELRHVIGVPLIRKRTPMQMNNDRAMLEEIR